MHGRWHSTLPLLTLLAACAEPTPMPEERSPPPLPEAIYMEAARRGAAVYRIQPRESLVLVQVGRAGPMKRLGHDHVVASEDVEGLAMLGDDPAMARADLRIPLRSLVVDKPGYRTRFGLDATVDEAAIESTYRNMQDEVLDSAQYPWAEVRAQFASATDDPPTLNVSVTLNGTAFDYLVPVELELDDRRLVVTGEMAMEHGDFGLPSYSAAGGLLRVAERLELEFSLVARRMTTVERARSPNPADSTREANRRSSQPVFFARK